MPKRIRCLRLTPAHRCMSIEAWASIRRPHAEQGHSVCGRPQESLTADGWLSGDGRCDVVNIVIALLRGAWPFHVHVRISILCLKRALARAVPHRNARKTIHLRNAENKNYTVYFYQYHAHIIYTKDARNVASTLQYARQNVLCDRQHLDLQNRDTGKK